MCLSFGEMIPDRPTLGLPLWNGGAHICEALSTEQQGALSFAESPEDVMKGSSSMSGNVAPSPGKRLLSGCWGWLSSAGSVHQTLNIHIFIRGCINGERAEQPFVVKPVVKHSAGSKHGGAGSQWAPPGSG